MSINMGDSSGVEYADHDVQVLYFRAQNESGETGQVDEVLQYDPVSERGLDNDELAELVGFRRTLTIYVEDEIDGPQSQPGNVIGEFGFGINLTEQEFAEQGGQLAPNEDVDNGTVEQFNRSEPGVIDSLAPFVIRPGLAPAADATVSAGGNSQNLSRTFFFPERLGSGPYIDSTDDLTLHVEAQKDNIVDAAQISVEGSMVLYWNVEEMPEGRASFSRP